MSNRNPPDPSGDSRAEVKRRRLAAFVEALINTHNGERWAPFLSRDEVSKALAARGYELQMDGDDFDPRKRRFFAMKRGLKCGDRVFWKTDESRLGTVQSSGNVGHLVVMWDDGKQAVWSMQTRNIAESMLVRSP